MSQPEPPVRLSIGVLGPVLLAVDGKEISLAREGVRSLLALLAMDANTVVSLDKIVDVLWGVRPPATARTIVQGYVSRLRKLLAEYAPDGATEILTRSPGYVLSVDAATVDVHHARELLARSRQVPARARSELLREAAALWRGTALADVSRMPRVAELTDLRLAVISERIDADLELGKDVELVGELRELLAEHPYFERGVGQLMNALYRCGRRAEALESYRLFSRKTADELGIDPGPQLARLYGQILRDDPELANRPGSPGTTIPAQLPAADAGFVGRERELAWLDEQLADLRQAGANRIAVLSGPAGVGKSSLALTWSHSVAHRFDGGQLYAALHGYDARQAPATPGEVLTWFLTALGVPAGDIPEDIEERAAMYRTLLAGRNLLIVLDDARDSAQVRPLLAAGESSMVLVSSRRRLAGLAARDGARTHVLDMLTAGDAQRVIETANAPLAADDSRELVRLCGRLPLALRIMTARLFGGTRTSVERVRAELADEHSRLAAFRVEGQDTSVHAVLDVSYRRLPTAVARTFATLGVLPGPWITPRELAALCGTTVTEASAHLLELTSANLVLEPAPGCFAMHDLVRLFARERASRLGTGAIDAALRRLVRYYLVVADQARRLLRPPHDSVDLLACYGEVGGPGMDGAQHALDWFESHWQHLIAAQRAAADAGMHTESWQMARVVHTFRMMRPLADNWLPVIERGLRSALAASDMVGEAEVRLCRSSYYVTFDVVEKMIPDAERAAEIAREAREPRLLLVTLYQLVGAFAAAGRFEEAIREGERVVPLARASGDTMIESRTLANLAQAELQLGRLNEAIAHQRAAMAADADSADHSFAAHSGANLAELEMRAGSLDDAETHARAAAELAAELVLPLTEAFARQMLGSVLLLRGDAVEAETELRHSLAGYRRLGSPRADEVSSELARLTEMPSDQPV